MSAASTHNGVRGPLRFRRRLTLAFVAIVGFAAGVPAIFSYTFVEHQREDLYKKRSYQQMQLVLTLTRGSDSASRADALIDAARIRNGFDTLIVADTVVSSNPSLTVETIPKSLLAANDDLKDDIAKVGKDSYLVVASDIPNSEDRARIYLWFSRETVISTLQDLRDALIISWAAVMIIAAVIGRVVAIRTLAPIQMAADAARQRAEGLLDTRLPDSGKDEFQAWTHYFNDIAGDLEKKIQELSAAHERERRFTADVAHDLRTPLGSMVSAASILNEYVDELPEGARRPTELLIGDVKRLRRLVMDLLEIGRLDSNRDDPNLEPIDVEALIRGVTMSLQKSQETQIKVSGNERIHSDRFRLERILSNLIENAYVHGGQDVQVNATASDELLVIEVRDGGPGIPEDHLPLIFERFHKVSPSRTGGGSGLGLAIACQHTAILGGRLSAENAPSGGALFRLEVPVQSQIVQSLTANSTEGFVPDRG